MDDFHQPFSSALEVIYEMYTNKKGSRRDYDDACVDICHPFFLFNPIFLRAPLGSNSFSSWGQVHFKLQRFVYNLLTSFLLNTTTLFPSGYPMVTETGKVIVLKLNFKADLKFQMDYVYLSGPTPTDIKLKSNYNLTTTPMWKNSSFKTTLMKCSRCYEEFVVDNRGKQLGTDPCNYHWGRFVDNKYTCCQKIFEDSGCESKKFHVWDGTVHGLNLMNGFVETSFFTLNYKIYAIDCEMSYTVNGLELVEVAIVNIFGQVVYHTLVKPKDKILDFNSKYSGITEESFKDPTKYRRLEHVHRDLLAIISSETILVGHDLANDLIALKLVHSKVVDTSIYFTHPRGFPYRMSLKNIAKSVLNKDIQQNQHNSIEDARIVMEIALKILTNCCS